MGFDTVFFHIFGNGHGKEVVLFSVFFILKYIFPPLFLPHTCAFKFTVCFMSLKPVNMKIVACFKQHSNRFSFLFFLTRL